MKIAIMSDLHNEFGVPYEPTTEQLSADVVVLAGDIDIGAKGAKWAVETFPGQEIVYVTGNHEYYHNVISDVDRSIAAIDDEHENFNFLQHPRNNIAVIGDVAFIGSTLWTDFCYDGNRDLTMHHARTMMNDYRIIKWSNARPDDHGMYGWDKSRYPVTPFQIEQVHQHHLAGIEGGIKWAREAGHEKIVVVTHHGCTGQSIDPDYVNDRVNGAYVSDLSEFILSKPIDVWHHGHVHFHNDYMVGDTRVIANPRGYVTKTSKQDAGFKNLVIEV